MEMVSNDLISKQIFPNLSSKKEVHEFTYAKINMFQEEKKKREIKIEMKIQLRPECTCMEFVPCSSFRNILKVFESVMRMRIFFIGRTIDDFYTFATTSNCHRYYNVP